MTHFSIAKFCCGHILSSRPPSVRMTDSARHDKQRYQARFASCSILLSEILKKSRFFKNYHARARQSFLMGNTDHYHFPTKTSALKISAQKMTPNIGRPLIIVGKTLPGRQEFNKSKSRDWVYLAKFILHLIALSSLNIQFLINFRSDWISSAELHVVYFQNFIILFGVCFILLFSCIYLSMFLIVGCPPLFKKESRMEKTSFIFNFFFFS